MNRSVVLINILTRTSNRPIGFYNCRKSITNQTYKNIKQYISFENNVDLGYLDDEEIYKVKVEKYNGEVLTNPEGHLHAPYNLYCNELLAQIEDGWILFLDDDDHLLHNNVIKEIVSEIHKSNEDTLFIWQMRYPNGKILPLKRHFNEKQVEFRHIGSPCFLFHSKYKEFAKWDHWKASDYRVVKKLHERIPNKRWIEKVYIQINNYGDFGNKNDILEDVVTSKLIFNKNWLWFLIPKYHTQIKGQYIFQLNTYQNLAKRYMRKIKGKMLLK